MQSDDRYELSRCDKDQKDPNFEGWTAAGGNERRPKLGIRGRSPSICRKPSEAHANPENASVLGEETVCQLEVKGRRCTGPFICKFLGKKSGRSAYVFRTTDRAATEIPFELCPSIRAQRKQARGPARAYKPACDPSNPKRNEGSPLLLPAGANTGTSPQNGGVALSDGSRPGSQSLGAVLAGFR
jgi:hypothetical protein